MCLVQYLSIYFYCFIITTGFPSRNHQNKVCAKWNCSPVCLSWVPSLVWMWVMRASGDYFIRPACVRSGFPRGGWYVIRPSCLVQPLYGSIAAPVTNSWPLRCVTLKEVDQESNPSGAKMMDGVIAARPLTAIPPQLASDSLSLIMKSNYTNKQKITGFFFYFRWCHSCGEESLLCIFMWAVEQQHSVYIYSHVYFILEHLQPFALKVCPRTCMCVGKCATEQKQFWRRILEMDGLPKIF